MPVGKCDCLFITELNIEINEISKKYIKVCERHAETIFKSKEERHDFKFNKKKKIYYCKNPNSDHSIEDMTSFKSTNSLYNTISTSSVESDDTEIIDFGKYKGMSFNDVCKKYRNYCVNILNLKSRKKIDNDEMDKFVYYLNRQFSTPIKKIEK